MLLCRRTASSRSACRATTVSASRQVCHSALQSAEHAITTAQPLATRPALPFIRPRVFFEATKVKASDGITALTQEIQQQHSSSRREVMGVLASSAALLAAAPAHAFLGIGEPSENETYIADTVGEGNVEVRSFICTAARSWVRNLMCRCASQLRPDAC